MSHHPSDIDKTYKEELFDYAPLPDAKVWQHLEQRLEAHNAKRKSPALGLLLLLGIGLTVAAMLFYKNELTASTSTVAPPVQDFKNTSKVKANADIVASADNSQSQYLKTNAPNLKNELSHTSSSQSNTSTQSPYTKPSSTIQKTSQSSKLAFTTDSPATMAMTSATAQKIAINIEANDDTSVASMPTNKEAKFEYTIIDKLPLVAPSLYEEQNMGIAIGMSHMPILVREHASWKLGSIGLQYGVGNAYRTLNDADATEVNKKYFNQYETKGRAWSAGIGLTLKKSRHWSIQTGLTYASATLQSSQSLNAIYSASGLSEGIYSTSFNNSIVNFVPTNLAGLKDGDLLYYQVKANQTITQINLPVVVAYKILFGRLGLEMGLGGQANIITDQQLGIDNASSFFKEYYTNNAENNKKIYWSTLCKIQLSYPISSLYDWQIGAQYDFANSAANSGKSVQYLPFNKYFTTGLSMHF